MWITKSFEKSTDLIYQHLNSTANQNYETVVDHGQCEVSCDSTPGHTTPSFTRFGFMPDGVTCVGGSDPWDRDDWPRKSGSYYMCLDGLCQVCLHLTCTTRHLDFNENPWPMHNSRKLEQFLNKA